MGNKPVVLLTVPHAICPASRTGPHQCDTGAMFATIRLGYHIVNEGVNVYMHKGDVPRTVIDYNRPESRNTLWQKEIGDFMKRVGMKCGVWIDVHSFPPDSEWSPYQVVLLDYEPYDSATKYLFSTTSKDSKIRMRILGGERHCNLNTYMGKEVYKVHTTLLEFNEAYIDTDIGDYVLKEIAKNIVSFVRNKP
jgi:hypothetical protein